MLHESRPPTDRSRAARGPGSCPDPRLRASRVGRRACALVLLAFLGTVPVAGGVEPDEVRVLLAAGQEVSGRIVEVLDDRLRLEGRSEPIALYEIREIVFVSAGSSSSSRQSPPRSADQPPDRPDGRAFLAFESGQILPAKILESDGSTLTLRVRGRRTRSVPYGESVGELTVPLGGVRGFRLREAFEGDAAFEEALAAPPPAGDLVFVRRGGRLIRIEGVFRGIDADVLTVEFQDRRRRIRRSLVQGVIFAPVAPLGAETGYEGTLVIVGGGELPAVLKGLEAPAAGGGSRLDVTVLGRVWRLPMRVLRSIRFDSDRIRFLSDLEPSRVEEVPFFDQVFPHRRDLSVGGKPLSLAGVEYARGLGVHSRSILEYDLGGDFTSFVARVGVQDGDGSLGDASIQVLGDGQSLLRGRVRGGEPPLDVAVSVAGVRTLRLETDFGEDGSDIGDHVNWVEARVVKEPPDR